MTSRKPSGEIRQSQMVTSFGPGVMVDLPKYSVLISGLEHWIGYRNEPIYEDRLASKVCELLAIPRVSFYAPPAAEQNPSAPLTGVKAFKFPNWYVAQLPGNTTWKAPSGKEYQTRPLVPSRRLDRDRFIDPDGKRLPVVPVRFVQACLNGHISDIDWYRFVNLDCEYKSNCAAQLWMDEGGTGNDFADIFIRCAQCKKRRPLSDATIKEKNALGYCRGNRPWLGKVEPELCTDPESGKSEKSRLLVRSASNAYFSQTLSVISIPDPDQRLKKAVDSIYEKSLKNVDTLEEFKTIRKVIQDVAQILDGLSDEAVWLELQRRKSGALPDPKSIKQVEIEALLATPTEVGEDVPESDFYARARDVNELDANLASRIDRIVLVHRLRAVTALVGFTRFEAEMPDIGGDLSLNLRVRRAALDVEPTWVPAVENRGEGVLLSFRRDAIEEWSTKEAVIKREKELREGFQQWCNRRGIAANNVSFPGLAYIMLHSLSHLLITAVSLECGYAASSVKERIYTGDSGYGILLYTGTSGSEGTLGGLVQVGRNITHHLAAAFEYGKLCSNDPICAQHKPSQMQEERFLHGAACHGCLLIAETCCEFRNEYLDRSLVIDTVENSGCAFFPEEVGSWLRSSTSAAVP